MTKNTLIEYCYDRSMGRQGTSLAFLIRINCNGKSFYEWKSRHLEWLRSNRIYLNQTTLTTSKTTMVGWIGPLPYHLCYTEKIIDELQRRFKTEIPFQVCGRNITSPTDKKLRTYAAAIETETQHALALKTVIMANFLEANSTHDTDMMKHACFIPINHKGVFTDDEVTTMIKKNRVAKQCCHRITIGNTPDPTAQISFTTMDNNIESLPLIEWLLMQKLTRGDETVPLFNAVSPAPNNCLWIYCDEKRMHHCLDWLRATSRRFTNEFSVSECEAVFNHPQPFYIPQTAPLQEQAESYASKERGYVSSSDSGTSYDTQFPKRGYPPSRIMDFTPDKATSPLMQKKTTPRKQQPIVKPR